VDYFDLRGVDTQTDLLRQTVVVFQSALDIATQRFIAGVASDSDVALAQTQCRRRARKLIDLGVMRAQLEHAIATLIGEAASTFALPPNATQSRRRIFPPASPRNCWNGDPTWRPRSAWWRPPIGRGIGHRRVLSRSGCCPSPAASSRVLFAMATRPAASGRAALVGTLFDGGLRKPE